MLFVVFPLLLLIFVFLCLIFVNLINMCLGVFLFGFILFGTLWVSWNWMIISFPILGSFQLLSPQVFSHILHGKVSACNVGDPGSIPGLGRSPGEGDGCPRHY